MTIKLIGAVLVFTGCGGFGFAMAASHRREEQALRQLILALEFMECDLSCRMTPLPQLCRNTSNVVTGPVHILFSYLARELEARTSPDVSGCVRTVLEKVPGVADSVRERFQEMGNTLGLFDLPGQLRGLRSAGVRTQQDLDEITKNRDNRIRSYQTLGLCAGAALAILFL